MYSISTHLRTLRPQTKLIAAKCCIKTTHPPYTNRRMDGFTDGQKGWNQEYFR